VFEGLKGTMYPCVAIKHTDTEVTVSQMDEGGLGMVSRPVAAALSMFICDLLINLTSKDTTGAGAQDSVAQIEAARRLLLTEAGLARVGAPTDMCWCIPTIDTPTLSLKCTMLPCIVGASTQSHHHHQPPPPP
jgi:hypothetical protein